MGDVLIDQKTRSNLLLLSFATGLAACATAAPVYDPVLPGQGSGVQIASASLMPNSLPAQPSAADVPVDPTYMSAQMNAAMDSAIAAGASPGAAAAGGILGALIVGAIEASIDANRNNKFRDVLESQDFDPQLFSDALELALNTRGISTTHANVSRAPRNFVPSEQRRDVAEDVAIDIVVRHYGYALRSGGWSPSLVASIQVEDASSGNMIINDSVAFGSPPAVIAGGAVIVESAYNIGGTTVIAPYNPHYVFESVGAMQDDPEKATKGLQLAITETTAVIADLIAETNATE